MLVSEKGLPKSEKLVPGRNSWYKMLGYLKEKF